MSFDLECAQLIQRHMQEIGKNITTEAILSNPRYKRVWAWWQALAYFKERNHYRTLEEAPEGLKSITIMTDGARQEFAWRDGYEFAQSMSKEDVKRIYGEE